MVRNKLEYLEVQNYSRAITQTSFICLRHRKTAKRQKGKIFSKWAEVAVLDKQLKRQHEEKAYAQNQNLSGALLPKKERQNQFINFGTYICCPIKITILVLESNEKIFTVYLDILPLSLPGQGQYVLSTNSFTLPVQIMHFTFFKKNYLSDQQKNLIEQFMVILRR